ncbi:type VI secretion system protein TssA [Undibacterium sp.]|uniref:type VI secretion system protein TssA n=1 Tax=Undibacterium sp. TaxID=1914977 RepID=UPI00374D358F
MADLGKEDVDKFLQDISAEEPSGPNLEYDPAFLELEQAAKGKPEVQYGGTITAEVPPDWKQVKNLSLELIARSQDLRVAVPLARALLKLQGVSGLAAGLLLIERMLEQHWDTVHPQLDPDDGLDPMLRVNTLSALCESSTILRDFREAPLVASRAHGRYSLKEIDISTGEVEAPEGEEKVALAVIDAAFADADADINKQTLDALEQAFQSNARIESVLTDKVGVAQALDLSPLTKLLKRARDFVRDRIAPAAEATGGEASSEDNGSAPAGGGVAPAAITGEVRSREDVVRMLDKICAYYARNEPSSPIPLLLLRAQRLVDKSFMEILQDLAPDGLNQIHTISGTQSES